jgi:hypothetical protein
MSIKNLSITKTYIFSTEAYRKGEGGGLDPLPVFFWYTKGAKKILIVADMSVNGLGGGGTPCPQLNGVFLKWENDGEWSET